MEGKKFIAGIDEAGRGAVIGPLVVAGVSVKEGKERDLKRMGVRDSKELPRSRMFKLADKIEKIAKDIIVINIGPCKIDNYRRAGVSLNKLECMRFADVVNYLRPGKVFIDLPDTNHFKFNGFLKSMLRHEPEIVLEHRADQNYPIVGAASIMAKVAREKEIEKLKKRYGDFGPGYSSNPRTIQWLKDWREKNREFPDIVRKTWITAEAIDGEKKQRKLSSWFGGIIKT